MPKVRLSNQEVAQKICNMLEHIGIFIPEKKVLDYMSNPQRFQPDSEQIITVIKERKGMTPFMARGHLRMFFEPSFVERLRQNS